MNAPSPNQSKIIWLSLTALALAALGGTIALAVWGLGKVLGLLSPVLWPLAVAGVLAYLLDPLVDWLEKRRVPRTRAIILVFFVAAGLLAAVFASVIPRVVVESNQLIAQVPEYTRKIQTWVENFIANPPAPLRDFLPFTQRDADPAAVKASAASIANVSEILASALPVIGTWLLGQFGKVATLFGLLAGFALIPVYAFYFLLEKRAITDNWAAYLPVADPKWKEELAFVIRAVNDHLIAFFRGQVLVAICDAVLYTIGFLVIGLNYAFLLGFVAVFVTMIPFIGAFIVVASALVLAFVQFGDWQHPAMVLAVFAVVQFMEGFVIQPKILGDRMRLHPLAIIIAVMAGTTLLGGVLGGILAIPLAAALRVLMFRYIWKQTPQ
jgi:predicted PurR-regulated permease PerM